MGVMEDLVEKARRGETRKEYRVPSKGVSAGSRRIAQAVDDEEWQMFRYSLKGQSTQKKLDLLHEYFYDQHKKVEDEGHSLWDCDVCIRVDNYIKALCRGGQLHAGESLETAINHNWDLIIKK